MLFDEEGKKTNSYRLRENKTKSNQDYTYVYESEFVFDSLIMSKIDYIDKKITYSVLSLGNMFDDIEEIPWYEDDVKLKKMNQMVRSLQFTTKMAYEWGRSIGGPNLKNIKIIQLSEILNEALGCPYQEIFKTTGTVTYFKYIELESNNSFEFSYQFKLASVNLLSLKGKIKALVTNLVKMKSITTDYCQRYHDVMVLIFRKQPYDNRYKIVNLAGFGKIACQCDMSLFVESSLIIDEDDTKKRLEFFFKHSPELYNTLPGHTFNICNFKIGFSANNKDMESAKSSPVSMQLPHQTFKMSNFGQLQAVERLLYCCNEFNTYDTKCQELILTVI